MINDSPCNSFKCKEDRLAITDHLLTGEVFGFCDRHGAEKFRANNSNAVGSTTMWQCPPGSPPLEADVIFNAFSLEELMQVRREGPIFPSEPNWYASFIYRGRGISWVKGSVRFILKFALPPFSPLLPSVVQVSKQKRH